MVYKLGIDRNITSELGDLLYKNYGTTMAGLKVQSNWSLFLIHISNSMFIKQNAISLFRIGSYEFSLLQAIGYFFDNEEYFR